MTGQDVERQEDLIDAARERNFVADLRARGYVVLSPEEAAKGAGFQEEALRICRENGFVFESIGKEPGNWQHLAFTFYTMLCEVKDLLTPEENDG